MPSQLKLNYSHLEAPTSISVQLATKKRSKCTAFRVVNIHGRFCNVRFLQGVHMHVGREGKIVCGRVSGQQSSEHSSS